MQLTGNTVLITGGGSGIGRAFAEQFHQRGNQVIIAGRRKAHLEAVVKANPGMDYTVLDVQAPASIQNVAAEVLRKHPALNVLFNNAGIMQPDDAAAPIDDEHLAATVATNLLAPIRLTSALIEHLKQQPSATILNNTSGLAFTPLAFTAVYSATKAALHSYTLSLRFRLRNTSVRVQEIVPPWVATDLMNSSKEEGAMPLDAFIAETFQALATDAPEILVERVKPLRNNAGPQEHAFVNQFNQRMEDRFAGH